MNVKLEQYRDPWLFEKADEVIGFYPREFYCLDNFSAFKVEYNGIVYSTAEHAYQTSKFIESAPDIAEQIRNSFSPHEAQKIAYMNKDKQNPNWDDIRLSVMEDILRAKAKQNPYVRKKLVQTKDFEIVEDSPKDSYWGWGADRKGDNHLGNLWMKLRCEVRNGGKYNE